MNVLSNLFYFTLGGLHLMIFYCSVLHLPTSTKKPVEVEKDEILCYLKK